MKSTTPVYLLIKLTLILICGAALLFGSDVAQAQLGSGWNVYTPSERLEYETNDILYTISPPPSSFNNGFCAYNKSGSTRTFQLLNHSSNRIEIRPNDDYSSGTHQFQADIVMSPPTSGECLHQIFNGPTGPWCIIRQYTNYNGSIRIFAGSSTSYVATNLNDHSFRLNTINDMNSGQCYFYVNGRLVYQTANPGGTFYTKYGTYGTHDNAHPAYVVFNNATLFTGGNESGAGNGDFSLSASPGSVSVTQGNNATTTITETDLNGYAGTVDLAASGLPSGVTASFNPNPTTGTSTLTLTASSTAATGTATVTITGIDNTIVGQTLTHSTTISLTVNASGGSLPAGWTDADIGAVGIAGSASYSSGTFTLLGSGSDIWNPADQFNYAYQSINGDQTIVARVASEDGNSSYAKAGVMIRESTADDSVEASVLVTPTNGVAMEIRPTTGAASINVAGWTRSISPPQWVKLVRSGSTFSGYYSANGSSWTQIDSTNMTMNSSATAGLAVTSHDNTSLNTAAFDNVSITATPPPDFTISASPSSQIVTAGNNTSYTATIGSLNGFNGSVSLNVTGLPANTSANFNPGSVSGSGNSTLTVTTTTSTPAGTYTLTISGMSGSLNHSTTVSLTVNPAPDFSLSASPGSLTITQGNNGTNTITVNAANGFNSSVSLTASGLPSGVTASFNPSSTTSSSTLTFTASGTATTGTATVTVTGTSGSLQHTTTISLTVNAAALPAGWTDADIGAVGLAGSAGYNNGTFTVSGSGSDIWNTGDQFNYVYQSVSGDMTIVARVVSEDSTSSYAKAGVMIRETLVTNSIEASVLVTPTNGVAMEVRSTTGAASINVAGWVRSISPPQWVKLVRSGNTFTSYYSVDGSSWTQIASTNVTMNSSATAGLAVTSHDNTSLNTATFDNVSITEGSVIDTSKIYKLQNEASGLVLNNQGFLTNGSAITQWTATTTSSNLDWTFIATSGGYYQINSCKSGLDAVVQGTSTANGAGIVQWSFGSTGNDQWVPQQNSDGSYTFYNLHSGLVLEDPGSSTNKTTQMDQWSANGGSNQKWMLLPQ